MLGEKIPWDQPKYGRYPTIQDAINDLVMLAHFDVPETDDEFMEVYGALEPKIEVVDDRLVELYGGFREGDGKRAKRFFYLKRNDRGTIDIESWGYDYDNQWS